MSGEGGRAAAVLRLMRDEAWGLFVDDGLFAGAVILWIVLAAGILPRLGLPGAVVGLLLFAGLAGILVLGARRGARRR